MQSATPELCLIADLPPVCPPSDWPVLRRGPFYWNGGGVSPRNLSSNVWPLVAAGGVDWAGCGAGDRRRERDRRRRRRRVSAGVTDANRRAIASRARRVMGLQCLHQRSARRAGRSRRRDVGRGGLPPRRLARVREIARADGADYDASRGSRGPPRPVPADRRPLPGRAPPTPQGCRHSPTSRHRAR